MMAAFEAERARRSRASAESKSRANVMGKPTGFMEYRARAAGRSRRRSERVRDWNEFHDHLPEKTLQRAGRALHGLRRAVLPHRAR